MMQARQQSWTVMAQSDKLASPSVESSIQGILRIHPSEHKRVHAVFQLGFCLQAAADQAWQQERSKLQTALQAGQQRLHDLERVNAQLQVHLDTHAREAAGQAPDEGTPVTSYGSIVVNCCNSSNASSCQCCCILEKHGL